ncbi:phosphocholine-specific phospholipase C [Streptomyces sp. NBC_00448]|uniref:phosphocholine-specific phospholipase C n=1 Tax=Streptomyces sp. NBC_00448 TaxID=2903652 RepID=UPI002E1BA9D2
MSPITRRTLLGSAAAVGAGTALGGLPLGVQKAMAASTGSGSLSSVKHVVILMQENRSFDHYYGTLRGVRGFGDTSPLRFPSGSNVWNQDTKGSAGGGGILQPWHLDTSVCDAQQVKDLDHSWSGTHAAWNNGLNNNWVPNKSGYAMGYYTRADVPFHHALADAFTICDQYFCSVQGPTHPNRLYLWTGMIDPAGTAGGPVTVNVESGCSWTTYPEMLQDAGVSWRVYQEADNYDCNPLAWFTQFVNAPTTSPLYTRGMARVASITSAISADIAAGTFPTVSWVVAPTAKSEHPAYRPADGADFVSGVLSAIAADQATWDSTVVFYNYDENDGFFDHVAPPVPAPGTAAEFVGSTPIGMGPRVPMTVISPWSTGGRVCSQVFDHTSPVRFAELVTGVRCVNISDWRRAVSGDLTSAFTFGTGPVAFPTGLPDTAALVAAADRQKSLPAPALPATGALPAQESGDRPAQPLGYVFDTASWTDTSTNRIWFETDNAGTLAGSFTAYTVNHRTFQAWNLNCPVGGSLTDYFSAKTYGGGPYDIDLHGPDGYLRGFQGNVLTWTDTTKAHPEARVVDNRDGATLTLTVSNAGPVSTVFTVQPNAAYLAPAGGTATTLTVAAGGSSRTTLKATSARRYDYTVTASTGDGFARRFAGRLYATSGSPAPAATHVLVNRNSGLAIDDPSASKAAGTALIQWPVDGGANQSWRFVPLPGGAYNLVNVSSGLGMNVAGGSRSPGAGIIQYPLQGSTNEQWTTAPVGDGYVTLTSVRSGLVLGVTGASTSQSATLQQQGNTGSASQQWLLSPA